MDRWIHCKRFGFAIPGTIMVLAVMSVLGVALWSIGHTERVQVDRLEKSVQAHFLARSGVEVVAEHFSHPENARNISSYIGQASDPTVMGAGAFTVGLSVLVEEGITSRSPRVLVRSTGVVDGVSRVVQAELAVSQFPDDAVILTEMLHTAGSAHRIVGSVIYDDLQGSGHIVYEGDPPEETMSYTEFLEQFGDLEPAEYYFSDKSFELKNQLDGETLDVDDPDLDTKDGYAVSGKVRIQNQGLTVQLGSKENPRDMYLMVDDLTARSEITIKGAGRLILCVRESFDGRGGFSTVIEPADVDAPPFVVALVQTDAHFALGPGNEFHGIVYGPTANLDYGAAGNEPTLLRGVSIGQNTNVRGRMRVEHWDFDISDLIPSGFRIVRWRSQDD